MTPPTTSEGLLDTSVLVALESERVAEDHLPERGAISAVTIGELHVGVLVAASPGARARRLQTLVFAERTYQAIPVSVEVARRFAELVVALRAERRRVPILDALIAATAIVHGLVLYTQDADFERFPGLTTAVLPRA